jgi:uncharacterized membrane protein
MNLAQTIHQKACEAAATLSGDLTPHELATGELETFKAQGFDPADFTEWLASFRAKRAQVRSLADEENQKLVHLANTLTASERRDAAAKIAAANKPKA